MGERDGAAQVTTKGYTVVATGVGVDPAAFFDAVLDGAMRITDEIVCSGGYDTVVCGGPIADRIRALAKSLDDRTARSERPTTSVNRATLRELLTLVGQVFEEEDAD